MPGDWSSATFLIAAAVMTGEEVFIKGVYMDDTQADRLVVDYLTDMGAKIDVKDDGIMVYGSKLTGCELDLNNTPDALPAMAVLGCYAQGRTIIKNVAHARMKETDRIETMTKELSKMGAVIEQFDDGMAIDCSRLNGAKLNGYNDHRVVMALSLAGMIADGKTTIDTAEAVNVTFPNYVQLMKNLGAKFEVEK
jgi:3-phosphoshikimate 1-carboxyvinyltransferase